MDEKLLNELQKYRGPVQIKMSSDVLEEAKQKAALKALAEFVDSLKEWCDKAEIDKWTAGDLLAFAVQRLELIKQEE